MEVNDLERLFDLKEKGIISAQEFEEHKALLMNAERPMIPIGKAYTSYWKKSFQWSGRATRAEYWWPTLVNCLISMAFSIVTGPLAAVSEYVMYVTMTLSWIFSLAVLFPSLAVNVRRFHDLGRSAWFACVPYIVMFVWFIMLSVILYGAARRQSDPSIGLLAFFGLGTLIWLIIAIIWLVFLCMPGESKANQYGDPR